MEILRTISLYQESNNIQFLLIGGHAINAYGISRQTGDIDLVVRQSDRENWKSLMEKISYAAFQDDKNFIRFKPDQLTAWPIDLMLVDNETFDKMYLESSKIQVGASKVNVVSRKHLILLKIHALKHYQEHRYLKDFNDVVALLRQKEMGVSNEELREFCLKYANENLYEKFILEIKND